MSLLPGQRRTHESKGKVKQWHPTKRKEWNALSGNMIKRTLSSKEILEVEVGTVLSNVFLSTFLNTFWVIFWGSKAYEIFLSTEVWNLYVYRSMFIIDIPQMCVRSSKGKVKIWPWLFNYSPFYMKIAHFNIECEFTWQEWRL